MKEIYKSPIDSEVFFLLMKKKLKNRERLIFGMIFGRNVEIFGKYLL